MSRQTGRRRLFDMLTALLRRDAAHCGEAVAWDEPALWQVMIPLADLHQVTPALDGALCDPGIRDRVPPDAAELLEAVHTLNADRNAGLCAQARDVLATLERAGIPAVPLKGTACLLSGLYEDDPGRRLMADIDILVPHAQARSAQDTLVANGYRPVPDPTVDEETDHHLAPLLPGPAIDGPGAIEVHFRLGLEQHAWMLPAERILADACTIFWEGSAIAIPRDLDLIDHAVVHSGLQRAQVRRRTLRLKEAFDIARLWVRARGAGAELADLRCAADRWGRRHLAACLLIAGTPESELGDFAAPGRRHLREVLWRQSIAERNALETSVLDNLRLVAENPRAFGAKFFHAERYRKLARLLAGRRT